MAVKLHRCKNVWVKVGGHPCWRVQKALDEAGVQYEVVPGPVRRGKRDALEADSGSASVRHEALELELAGARQAEADLRAAGAQQARDLAEATETLQAAFARLQYLEALFQQQPAQPQQPAPAAQQTRSPYAWQD